MKQVSEMANKPPVPEKENVIQMNPEMNNMQNNQNEQIPNPHNNGEDDFDEDKYSFNTNKVNNENKNTKKSDGKILGMSKPVFFGGLLVLAAVGGYFAYRHFNGKKAIKTGGGSTAKVAESASSSISASATEVAKMAVAK